MSYISLYRKYRPESFDSMIGQDHIVRTLKNQIKSGNIGHAYLFTGTRGTGKTSAAKIFARAVNCIDSKDGSPCGVCKVCQELNTSNNIDILEIDAASNNGVDEIRDIRDKVKYPPVSGKYKVYIVDEVHMLTTGAFNALLKTLEEPPKHIIFILATTEVHKLPQTILSRCMRFDFRLVSQDLIAKLIEGIFNDLNKAYEKEAIAAIASAGEGSVRDALSIADMSMSYRDGILTYKDVQEVIGASSPELLISLIDSVLNGRLEKLFLIVDDCAKAGKNFSILSRDISNVLRNLIYIKNSDNASKILQLPQDVYCSMKALADRYDTLRILTALESLCKLEGTMRYSVQPRIGFEAAMVRASVSGNELNSDALSRLKIVEDELSRLSKCSYEQPKNDAKPINDTNLLVEKKDNIIEEKTTKSIHIEEKILENKQNSVKDKSSDIVTEKVVVKDIKEEAKYSLPIEDKLIPTEEKAVFGAVKRINKGDDDAKEIIGKVIRELRKKQLYHLHGIFGYNDVKVWIENSKYYIQTFDEYGFNQLTDPTNHKIFLDELNKAGDGSFDKLVILQPKSNIDVNKSVETIKELFDNEILNIRK